MFILSNLLAYLGQFLTTCSYGKALETYIVSKNPQHPADVEFHTRQFQQKRFGGII